MGQKIIQSLKKTEVLTKNKKKRKWWIEWVCPILPNLTSDGIIKGYATSFRPQ